MDTRQQAQHPPLSTSTQFQTLNTAYLESGITFKSNEILHRIALIKGYPYLLLLDMAKQFHMNQFQILFYSHILNDEENCFGLDPMLFQTNMKVREFDARFESISVAGQVEVKIARRVRRQEEEQEQQQGLTQHWSYKQLKRLYIYLLVIGYSIKYYLNQSTKAYQDQLKQKYPQFFTTIFNIWVDKYSNKVLRTNPRKINEFYMQIFQSQDHTTIDNTELDCQYRNYNQIVQELIKAASDADDGGHAGFEDDKEFGDV